MTYLDTVWYCAALAGEVTTTPLARTICDRPLVLFRTETGRVGALEDRCSHRQAPLSMGLVIGEEIQCRYHGFVFDCAGACTHVPRQDSVPAAAGIAAYPAVERWGYVWLWLGAADKADPAAIPHLPWNADPALRPVFFHWAVNANFQLMADNLLDVSHTDFLHRDSIGSRIPHKGAADGPKVELTSRIEGGRVHSVRRVYDTLLGPVSTRWAGSAKPVTRSNYLMWEAPNTIHSVLEFKNDETHHTIYLDHIMTPATASTMHYFMNWTRDFGLDGDSYPTDAQVFAEQNAVIAGEDIPMVEAQFANLARFGDRPGGIADVPARQDRFVMAVHRTLARLYREAGKPVPRELRRIGRGEAADTEAA